jgi:hypothetical protein
MEWNVEGKTQWAILVVVAHDNAVSERPKQSISAHHMVKSKFFFELRPFHYSSVTAKSLDTVPSN